MKAGQFGWGIFGRVVLWGLSGGGVLGGIYGPISITIGALLILLGFPLAGSMSPDMATVWLVTSFLYGVAFGGLTGLLIGLIDGFVLSVTALWIVRSPGVALYYRRTLSIISALTGGLGAFVLFMWSGSPIPTYQGNVRLTWIQIGVSVEWFLWVVGPALIAAGYGWWVGNRITLWIVFQSDSKISPSLPLEKE